ncbi:electron transport complex subunit RsxB [Oxobacter pfennigii]|uniref:Electron transport complex subunit RsxB n=1 Tax=Oxobacter pfennigii TaxID=36849 RepID=A0A0P8X0G9_9CLOT|nr:4Fe-4S binding protein [Oxobacter pfennigii]KPU44255.1 electron transport complex subunit RsxB [Oxobacter pfennigii]
MIRKIITIDEDRCNGCGICINACHEGALKLIDGKAKLVSESYCDGLGACLPECPTGAMKIIEREADDFDEEAVKKNMEAMKHKEEKPSIPATLGCGCPGSQARAIEKKGVAKEVKTQVSMESQLNQWPVQIKLVPPGAPYFENAHLLVAADCTAFAYANIHNDFMRNKITIIGCPKLDAIDYSEKLTQIIMSHEIKSITVLRMEVPCCGGIVNAVKQALLNSGKLVPWSVVTIGTNGDIIEN